MYVDVIKVEYPGAYRRDSDAIFVVSKRVKQAVICDLAGNKPDEIASVAGCPVVQSKLPSTAEPPLLLIADSLGIASPRSFAQLLETVMHRVPNIDQAAIAVHCHG